MMPSSNQDTKSLWAKIERLEQEMRSLRAGILQAKEVPKRHIYAEYSTAAGQNIQHNTTTIINYGTKVIDSHNAVTTGDAWRFTAPATTYYLTCLFDLFSYTTAWAVGEFANIILFKNGAANKVFDRDDEMTASATNQYKALGGTGWNYLKTGEYIDIRVLQLSGGALQLYNDASHNWITILGLQGI